MRSRLLARRSLAWLPRVPAWVFVLVAAVLAFAAPGLSVLAEYAATTAATVALRVAAVLCAGLAYLVGQAHGHRSRLLEESAAQRVVEARTTALDAVTSALGDVMAQLGRIADTTDPARQRERVAETVPYVLHAAQELIGPPDCRVSWYAASERPAGDGSGLVTELRLALKVGRSPQPVTRWDETTPTGARLVDQVLNGRSVLAPDLVAAPPAWWQAPPGCDFTSFVAVPVSAGRVVHGMLLLDCDQRDVLGEVDERLLGVLGGALGTTLRLQPPAA